MCGVKPAAQARAVAQADLERERRRRLIDLSLRRPRRSRSRSRRRRSPHLHRRRRRRSNTFNPWRRAPQPLPLPTKRHKLLLGRLVVLLAVRMDLQIDLLALLHVQQVERRAPAVDHLERRGVGRVVEAEERAVVDAEAVAPEVQIAVYAGRGGGGVGGGGGGRFDDGRGRVVAAEGLASAGEAVRLGGGVFAAWAGGVSESRTLEGEMVSENELRKRTSERA